MQARSSYTILRGITAILLVFSLLISIIGVHIDVAFCGENVEHINVLHKSEKKASCCAEKTTADCCTTQEIVQQASVYDFLVNTGFKLNQPAVVALHYFTVASYNIARTSKNFWFFYKPPPPLSKLQSEFQVFLC